MIKLAWGSSFRRAFKRYTRHNQARQRRVLETLDELASDPFHPTLKTHKLSGELKGLYGLVRSSTTAALSLPSSPIQIPGRT